MASKPRSEHRINCDEAFSLNEGRAGLESGGRALRVRSRGAIDNYFALARGEDLPAEPIDFVRASGRKPYDLIGTTYAVLTLISPRFRGVLEENNFTGWTTYPTKVFLDDGSELEDYRGFAVTGRCGPIDDKLSEKVMLAPPVTTGEPMPGLRGMCFDPDSWDGSDIFTPEGFAGIYVVERVKKALEAARITNITLRRLSEIERTWRADGGSLTND